MKFFARNRSRRESKGALLFTRVHEALTRPYNGRDACFTIPSRLAETSQIIGETADLNEFRLGASQGVRLAATEIVRTLGAMNGFRIIR